VGGEPLGAGGRSFGGGQRRRPPLPLIARRAVARRQTKTAWCGRRVSAVETIVPPIVPGKHMHRGALTGLRLLCTPLASRRWLRTAVLRLPPPTPQPRRSHGPSIGPHAECLPVPRPCIQRRSCLATRPVLSSLCATSPGTRRRAVLPPRRRPAPRATTTRTETPSHSCMGRTAMN